MAYHAEDEPPPMEDRPSLSGLVLIGAILGIVGMVIGIL